MTEPEWRVSGNPKLLLDCLTGEMADRKLRLLGCAFCRLVWTKIVPVDCRRCVEVAELFADKKVKKKELVAAFRKAERASHDPERPGGLHVLTFPSSAATVGRIPFDIDHVKTIALLQRDDEGENDYAVHMTDDEVRIEYFTPKAWDDLKPETKTLGELQAACVRCVFGSPFRPASFSDQWRTDTAVSLARQMYDARDFSAMPILGDALQDAGCDNEDVLNHCRSESGHVRGCWVVDLVLGKE